MSYAAHPLQLRWSFQRNIQRNPAKFPETKCFSSGPNSGYHWTSDALIYNISCVISHGPARLKNIMSPALTAALIPPEIYINDTFVEKTPRNVPVWQKIRQSIPLLIYSSTEQLQVALWTFMFIRLKQRKVSSHPPSAISPFPIFPSLIPPSTNPPSRLLGQFDY